VGWCGTEGGAYSILLFAYWPVIILIELLVGGGGDVGVIVAAQDVF